jgi:hypothetical protein
VLGEASAFAPELQNRLGVRDRRLDLGAVADDSGVVHQPLDIARAEARDRGGIEASECAPVPVALAQDGRPREPGLRTLEHEQLEQMAFVVRRNTPLLVVVGEQRLARRPAAARALARYAPPQERSSSGSSPTASTIASGTMSDVGNPESLRRHTPRIPAAFAPETSSI